VVGSDATTYSDTKLDPSTIYWYRVQSYNSGGTSGYSNSVSEETYAVSIIHVSDIDGSSTLSKTSRWDATVSIRVVAAGGDGVEGATVTGHWDGSATGSSSAVTDADGWCTITKSNIKSNVSSVTFTIDGVDHGSDIYDSSSNVADMIVILQPS